MFLNQQKKDKILVKIVFLLFNLDIDYTINIKHQIKHYKRLTSQMGPPITKLDINNLLNYKQATKLEINKPQDSTGLIAHF